MVKKRRITSNIVCWHIIDECNRSCSFCLSKRIDGGRHRATEYRAILDRLKYLNVEKLSYSGGEPFLHPEFMRIIKHGNKLNISQVVTTNGDILIRSIPDWIHELECIRLSFYGAENTHNLLMGNGHFGELLRVANEINGKANVGANFMVWKRSLSDITSFLEEVLKVGITRVLFQIYKETGRDEVDSVFRISKVEETIDDIKSRCRGFRNDFPDGLKIHILNKERFLVVLDPDGYIEIPNPLESSKILKGSIWQECFYLNNSRRINPKYLLQKAWDLRSASKAIIALRT